MSPNVPQCRPMSPYIFFARGYSARIAFSIWRSSFLAFHFPLPWPVFAVDTSVAHLKAICSRFRLLRHFSSLVGRFGLSRRGATGLPLPGFW
ncbi:MAG: hypothetical protein OXF55_17505 [Caldilineaceae bacterium]|nr:hypothetical protein [Caldilineaceae bacterium]